MLFDVVASYTEEEQKTLRSVRENLLLLLAKEHDTKKLVSFLAKAGVLYVDDSKHIIHIGIPNEFVLMQIKKFFHKSIVKAAKDMYNQQFNVEYHIYTPFQNKNHALHVDITKLFAVALEKEERKIYKQDDFSYQLASEFGVTLSSQFSFDTLVVGSHNEFAVAAAKAVVDQPGIVYNPLFIYGGVGLGKTHLLQAIGQEILGKGGKKVLYLPTTVLIDAIIAAIRKNKLSKLKADLCQLDVLLLDDVQFLGDKDKTQEVFHDIFNDLVMHNKQIVLTSDQPPKDLNGIEPRLRSRFAKGIIADIKVPDYETRIAILQSKLQQKGEVIDANLLAILAKNIVDNIRELEGALNIILTKKRLTNAQIDEKTMYECLGTLGYNVHGDRVATMEDIAQLNTSSIMSFSKLVEFVSQYYDISPADLKSDKRSKDVSSARQLLMVIAKKYFNRTLEKIGDYFGGKNHAAVIYACKNFEKKIKTDKALLNDYNLFVQYIKGK